MGSHSLIFPFSTSFSVEGELIKTELKGGFEMLSSRFLSGLFPITEHFKTAVGIFLKYGRQVWADCLTEINAVHEVYQVCSGKL